MKRLILLGALALAACGGGRSAPERYNITTTPVETQACRSSHASIKIYEPTAAPGLDSWRIAVLDKPNHLTYYKGVAWSATTGRLVQHALADTIAQSGKFSSVSTDLDTVPATYSIESDLAEFNTDLTGPEPRIRIRLQATLIDARTNHVLAAIPLVREADINNADMQDIVDLFAEQMHSMSEELIDKAGAKIAGCL